MCRASSAAWSASTCITSRKCGWSCDTNLSELVWLAPQAQPSYELLSEKPSVILNNSIAPGSPSNQRGTDRWLTVNQDHGPKSELHGHACR